MPKKKPKPDPAQVAATSKWVLAGASSHDVAEAIRANFPEADPPALILEALEEFRKAGNLEPLLVRGFCFEATKAVYQKALENNDIAGALRALRQILELTKCSE